MKFPDLYIIYTAAPKRRTKTMLIGLSKITQNSPETPQNTNNLPKKYNHDKINIFSYILTSKYFQYRRKPNWYEILNQNTKLLQETHLDTHKFAMSKNQVLE